MVFKGFDDEVEILIFSRGDKYIAIKFELEWDRESDEFLGKLIKKMMGDFRIQEGLPKNHKHDV